ncbi:MAG: DUF3179 domain-containing protein [Pseudomonadaceae bacterium]|nr:DUF3179 domain-containing protein [Pseudomonadaceae bacterium]
MSGVERAWPLSAFEGGQVINDQVGVVKIVLIGDAQTRTVRAYRRGDYEFTASRNSETVLLTGDVQWTMTESALISVEGEQLSRLLGHLSFWFACRREAA